MSSVYQVVLDGLTKLESAMNQDRFTEQDSQDLQKILDEGSLFFANHNVEIKQFQLLAEQKPVNEEQLKKDLKKAIEITMKYLNQQIAKDKSNEELSKYR